MLVQLYLAACELYKYMLNYLKTLCEGYQEMETPHSTLKLGKAVYM